MHLSRDGAHLARGFYSCRRCARKAAERSHEASHDAEDPWTKVRDSANIVGRWHDNRHTLVLELAESGAGDEAIMSIAGHVSRAMLHRYSHVRMGAKRRALDEIAARQRAADEKQGDQEERTNADASASALVQ